MPSHVTFKWVQYFQAGDENSRIEYVDLRFLESDGLALVQDEKGRERLVRLNPEYLTLTTEAGEARVFAKTLLGKLVMLVDRETGKRITWEIIDRATVRLHIGELNLNGPMERRDRRLRQVCNRLTEFIADRITEIDPDGEAL